MCGLAPRLADWRVELWLAGCGLGSGRGCRWEWWRRRWWCGCVAGLNDKLLGCGGGSRIIAGTGQNINVAQAAVTRCKSIERVQSRLGVLGALGRPNAASLTGGDDAQVGKGGLVRGSSNGGGGGRRRRLTLRWTEEVDRLLGGQRQRQRQTEAETEKHIIM